MSCMSSWRNAVRIRQVLASSQLARCPASEASSLWLLPQQLGSLFSGARYCIMLPVALRYHGRLIERCGVVVTMSR